MALPWERHADCLVPGMRVLARLLAIAITAASLIACGGVDNEDQAGSGGDEGCGPHPDPDECPTLYDCVDGTWVEVGQSLCTEPCPAEEPSQGDACASGADCSYAYDGYQCDGKWTATWSCTEAGWTRTADECHDPNVCGDFHPSNGDPCQVAAECDGYVMGFCDSDLVEWDCVATGDGMAWVVEYHESRCPQPCDEVLDAKTCAQTYECEWVEPGCGENPSSLTGCFSSYAVHHVDSCIPRLCPDGECVMQSIDPCWDGSCEACDEQIAMCVPLSGG